MISLHPAAGDISGFSVGGTHLEPFDPGPVTLIAAFDPVALAAPLAALGLRWPAAGEAQAAAAARLLWHGPDEALLLGQPCPDTGAAALADLSDAHLWLHLVGPLAEAALARLVPLDLRPSAFPEGRVARSLLNHVPLIVTRREGGLDLAVPRSMGGTAVDELTRALHLAGARLR